MTPRTTIPATADLPDTDAAAGAPAITVAAAMAVVDGWTDLTDQRRRDLRSALSTHAAMAGQAPEDMWLTPQAVRDDVAHQSAALHGITDARMKNIYSAVRAVMRRLGIIADADGAISPAWAAALALLAGRQGDGLRVFARFCTARETEPGEVDDVTLAAYLIHLTERSIKPDPRTYVGKLRGRWNRACAVADWPGRPIGAVKDPNQYVLPLADFPEPFRKDLDVFGNALIDADGDPAKDPDAAEDRPLQRRAAHRLSTVALRQGHARWAASALVASGVPIAEVISATSLVTPLSRARQIIRYLWERAGSQPSSAGMHVAEVLRIIAKYHARLPAKDCDRIRTWGDKVRVKHVGITLKNRTRVEQVMDPARLKNLLELPGALIAAARELRATDPAQARAQALRGLAIHLLLRTRLRLGNLLALEVGRHLQRNAARQTRITSIVVRLEETKNQQPIFLPVSTETAAMLQEWIDEFRPLVAAPDCPYLFPGHGTGGKAMTPQGLRDAVKSTLAHHLGVPLSPHQFRHLCANLHLQANPGEYQVVSRLLGHKSVVTAMRSYSGLETEVQTRRFDAMLDARRSEGQTAPPGKPAKRRAGR